MLETSSNTWRPTITKSYVNNVTPSLAKWSPPALIPKPHSTLAMCAIATTTIRVTLNSICSNTSVNRVAFLPLWWPRLEPIPTWPMFCNRPWPTGSTLGTSQSSINTSTNASIAIGALNIQVRFSYLPTWAGMDYLEESLFFLPNDEFVVSMVTIEFLSSYRWLNLRKFLMLASMSKKMCQTLFWASFLKVDRAQDSDLGDFRLELKWKTFWD